MATLSAGQFVGERSLLFDEPRACDVVVTSGECRIAFIDKKAFEACMGPISEVMQRTAMGVRQEDLVEFKLLGTGTFGKVAPPEPAPSSSPEASSEPCPRHLRQGQAPPAPAQPSS